MSRLILHIGTHKTATTSIQRFLRHHEAALSKSGVFYPDYDLVKRGGHYAHLGMVNGLSGRHQQYSQALAERFVTKVRERMVDYDTTIISAEPFYRHVANDPKDKPYYEPEAYWPLRHAYIERMRDLFGPAQVVVVFRRQMDFAQSMYQEHVKVTAYREPFRKFCRDFWYHFAFADQAEAWNAAFPGLRALHFEALKNTGEVISAFCREIGVDTTGLDALPPSNQGMPVDLVVMKRLLHRTTSEREILREHLETLAVRLPEEIKASFKHRSFFSSATEARKFQNAFAKDNERLRPFLPGGISSDKPVFSTALNPKLQYGDRIRPPLLAALLEMSLRAPSA